MIQHSDTSIVTIDRFIIEQEAKSPEATGELSGILYDLAVAAKMISSKVRRAGLIEILGGAGSDNVQGEAQQKLDVIANDLLMTCLGSRPSLAVVASEEDQEPTILRRGIEGGKYCVVFDPLDGSSNLDVSVGVGTIFSILRNESSIPGAVETLCQKGSQQVAAGYVLYGSSTVFVLTTGHGVDMFVLDPSIGSFVLVKRQVRIPAVGKTYSVNEANRDTFPEGIGRYLDWARAHGYSSRYIGSMVADIHRTLLKGGVFLYPPTKKNPEGKLRLMYEANPMAMIVEQAGGRAVTGLPGRSSDILDVLPTGIHQRTSVVIGSRDEVDAVVRQLG